jgi:hypothetical protein
VNSQFIVGLQQLYSIIHLSLITYLHQWVCNFIVDLLSGRINMVDSIESETLWRSRAVSWIYNRARTVGVVHEHHTLQPGANLFPLVVLYL